MLGRELAAGSGTLPVTLLIGDINRDTCDLNRASCTESSVRQTMLEAIRGGRHWLLMDAHSYPHRVPADNTIFARDSSAHKHNAWDADLFFVVNWRDKTSQDFFTAVLGRVRRLLALKGGAGDLRCLSGTDKLDLTHQGYTAGLHSVLIEVGEHLEEPRVAQLAAAIMTSVQQEAKKRGMV